MWKFPICEFRFILFHSATELLVLMLYIKILLDFIMTLFIN